MTGLVNRDSNLLLTFTRHSPDLPHEWSNERLIDCNVKTVFHKPEKCAINFYK